MTDEEFIAMTQKIIAKRGFDGYRPTLVLEARRTATISVHEDVPQEVDIESFAKEWAAQVVKRKQDYLLAFKMDDKSFKVVTRRAGVSTERLVTVEGAR